MRCRNSLLLCRSSLFEPVGYPARRSGNSAAGPLLPECGNPIQAGVRKKIFPAAGNVRLSQRSPPTGGEEHRPDPAPVGMRHSPGSPVFRS